MPNFTIDASGYGAGSREVDGLPNCAQVVIGTVDETADSTGEGPVGQPLVLVESNLDDATGEQVADTLEALLRAGSVDAWVTPVIMKKGRPGQIVAALCEVALVGVVRGDPSH